MLLTNLIPDAEGQVSELNSLPIFFRIATTHPAEEGYGQVMVVDPFNKYGGPSPKPSTSFVEPRVSITDLDSDSIWVHVFYKINSDRFWESQQIVEINNQKYAIVNAFRYSLIDEIRHSFLPEGYEFPRKLYSFKIQEEDKILRVVIEVKSFDQTFYLLGQTLIPLIFSYPFSEDKFENDLIAAIPTNKDSADVNKHLDEYVDYFKCLLNILTSDELSEQNRIQYYLTSVLGETRLQVIGIIEGYYYRALDMLEARIRKEVLTT